MKCITNETWELYAAGKLTPGQLQQIHQHALSCEPCVDTKEGIDAMADPSTLMERVQHINRLVDAKVNKGKQTHPLFMYIAAAASLIIAASLGWFLWTTQETPMALEQSQPVKITVPETTEPENNSALVDGFAKDQHVKENTETESTVPAVQQKPVVSTNPDIIEETGQAAGTADDMVGAPVQSGLEENKDTETSKVTDLKKEKVATIAAEKKATYKTENIPGAFNSNNLNNLNYTISSNKSNTPLDSAALSRMITWGTFGSDSFYYNKAVQHFAAKQYDSAQLTFSPLIGDSNLAHYEDSLMLLTKTQIKQQDKKNAEQNLKKVISIKGKRQKEAEGMMRGLK